MRQDLISIFSNALHSNAKRKKDIRSTIATVHSKDDLLCRGIVTPKYMNILLWRIPAQTQSCQRLRKYDSVRKKIWLNKEI